MAHALAGCVSSLQSSIAVLTSSIAILDSGVHDFPRLGKVLQATRHFELLPESALQTAQAALLSTITPELTALLARTEGHLDRLARRELALRAKCELQEGRLSDARPRRRSRSRSRSAGGGAGGDEPAGAREALRLRQLRLRKERLGYAVERLTLQAQQRERQLRMSMAAPGD